ncbi:F0F1 ATP synthase subunit epsilon [Populibacterium corticicola]|uniref:ATP synthase epsilon chain n=1 Tax=Populibacterium corticicola TaxID=1812826 RepID=A0ABW5XBD8_9MICO
MAQLAVNVVAKDQAVWSGEAKIVSAPAADGEIGILAGHLPILSVLNAGHVRITEVSGNKLDFTITGGFMSVDDDQVNIVADKVTLNTPAGA